MRGCTGRREVSAHATYRTIAFLGCRGDEAEIEDFFEGFNQPTYRGMRVNGVQVATWSSQHGWSGL